MLLLDVIDCFSSVIRVYMFSRDAEGTGMHVMCVQCCGGVLLFLLLNKCAVIGSELLVPAVHVGFYKLSCSYREERLACFRCRWGVLCAGGGSMKDFILWWWTDSVLKGCRLADGVSK